MNKKKAVQPLSENTRKAIIIAAIVAVAIVILSVSLALILKPDALTESGSNSSGNGSSTLVIKNGDFAYTSSDDTNYPLTAQNWTKYGYKAKSGSSHDFAAISTTEKVVMGIVNTDTENADDNWNTVLADLADEGITNVTNPKLHASSEAEDNNVYMIATKEATTASILSDSASISSGKSVKITVWLNTQQLAEGTNAVVMVQKSTVSAKSEYWYAYEFNINKDSAEYPADENGWQKLEFYIFNRDSSTKYIRVSVGIGNVYSGEEGLDLIETGEGDEKTESPITGEGILFVDDITYEEVTANDYRQVVDGDAIEHSYKIIENEDIVDKSKYIELIAENGDVLTPFTNSDDVADLAGGYSPFTDRDDFFKDDEEGNHTEPTGFKVYKLSNNGDSVSNSIAVRLSNPLSLLSSLTQKDHLHLSFWIRVTQVNKIAVANIYVQSRDIGEIEWTDLSNGSWTTQVTSQEIEEDSNAGWAKYDIYLKPSANEKEISILFVFGSSEYSEKDDSLGLYPDGDLYVTSPAYEQISYNDYNSASSGTRVKKIDLIGEESTASTTVTNGSFSTVNNTGTQPSSWTPAFAGDNTIYRDGKGNTEIDGLNRLVADIDGSGVQQSFGKTSGLDDDQSNVLLIKNNVATSFGYFSNNITLSSHTAYVFSVMAMTEDAGVKPYIYLLNTDTSLDRKDRVITSITDTTTVSATTERYLGHMVASSKLANGWTRYYIVVVTGNESQTVRLALFNGSIDGEHLQSGSLYFDGIELYAFSTYSLVDDETIGEDEKATNYVVEWGDGNYGKNFEELVAEDLLQGVVIIQPTEEEWAKITLIPETNEDEGGDNEGEETEKTPREVDWALLFSIISSVALVAALLVVVVVRYFNGKNKKKKAA